jgi:carbamoyltransferase
MRSSRWVPRRPRLTRWGGRTVLPLMDKFLSHHGLHRPNSRVALSRLSILEQAIRAGRETYVFGFNTGTHNSGAALVRISRHGTIELVCNEEEERYTAVKHSEQYPEHSIEAVKLHMQELDLEPADLVVCAGSWDYASLFNVALLHPTLEEAPASLTLLLRERAAVERTRAKSAQSSGKPASHDGVPKLVHSPRLLGRQFGLDGPMPIIGVRHHDCHAFFSYGVSPFAASADPVMVVVADGSGDDATMSLYVGRNGKLVVQAARGASRFDSLGTMYALLSSTQGGWPPLSSEGRYMGAAAWGDGNRLTNPYYRRLKHLLHFGPEGRVQINRTLTNWTRASVVEPYGEELTEILGDPIPLENMWNPDAILDVEDIRHPEITRDRVDKAAAVQMIFEDALVHIVDYAVRSTGGHELVLAGGTALNCVANMRLLECFDEPWYERNLGQVNTRLHIWVPPVPGDAGTPIGAAYAFAMRAGARPGAPLRHAFYCGHAATTAMIQAAVHAQPDVACLPVGDCSDPEVMSRVADLLAFAVADDLVIGLYQGISETGPRALGHRSILANPCNANTRHLLNERVKHRELIRPLAPMLTRTAAEDLFYLEEGAADDEFNAYNYMVLTAKARPKAREKIPAVIHHDGTGRIQIVRAESDPFCHEFLLAMGRRVGVEASVNTSLNVGAPIVHTPEQGIATLRRAFGMDGLLMIGAERHASMVWIEDRTDTRARLMESLGRWARETTVALPMAATNAAATDRRADRCRRL